MLDNKLAFMAGIERQVIDDAIDIRQKFIDLDNDLQQIELGMDSSDQPRYSQTMRTLALARTHLETCSMYAIKSLCIKYEYI